MDIFAAANTFEMNGTALFFIIIGGVIIWLVMTFLFANMDSGGIEILPQDPDKKSPKEKLEIIDIEDDAQKEKEKAYQEKKRRQRRKEYLKRLKITLKKTAALLLESSWMVGISIAVILTVYFITQNMLIE